MGGVHVLLFLVETITGRTADVLLSPHAWNGRFTIFSALRDVTRWGLCARNPPLGRSRDGDHRLATYVSACFLTGSYKPPREFNWVIGVLLLVLTLLLSFTGYLLPWDQLAIWAITVGSNMARATSVCRCYEGPGSQLLNVDGIDP